jgi:hypothetical protein
MAPLLMHRHTLLVQSNRSRFSKLLRARYRKEAWRQRAERLLLPHSEESHGLRGKDAPVDRGPVNV